MATKKKEVVEEGTEETAAEESVDVAEVEQEAERPAAKSKDVAIEVGDPEELRPVELPLVIKPAKGSQWANAEQAEYAAILNGYAYKNTRKFKVKKAKLIEQLVEIGKNPSKFYQLKGEVEGFMPGKLGFKDKRIGQ